VIHRGEIYFVDLNPTRGHEQRGHRPVLVVSADAINQRPLVVTVVVGTSAANVRRDYPVNVRVSATECGLEQDTVFLCFQLRSLDHNRFLSAGSSHPRPAGRLSDERMADVDRAIRLALALG
jgi:mRNA interferase MazF